MYLGWIGKDERPGRRTRVPLDLDRERGLVGVDVKSGASSNSTLI